MYIPPNAPAFGTGKKTAVLEVTNIWGMPHGKEGWLTEGRCGGRRSKEVRYGGGGYRRGGIGAWGVVFNGGTV